MEVRGHKWGCVVDTETPGRGAVGTNLTVTKKLRLSPEGARRLERLAKEMDMTESDVLREGIHLVERVRNRRALVEQLVAMTEGETWTKTPYNLK